MKKILIVGGDGRAHALAWACTKNPQVETVFVAPGNAGTANEPKVVNVPIPVMDIQGPRGLLEFAIAHHVDLTVVSPEGPLAAGIVDDFLVAGLRIFGPTRAAAQLETSKAWAKAFMLRHRIPTALARIFSDAEAAHAHIDANDVPIVVKASGLAAGKGVVVAMTRDDAHAAIERMMVNREFGAAGATVLIEQFLGGLEASYIVMVDANGNVLALETSQDHKLLYDGDQGPNTGGMGAYSPAPIVTPSVHARVMREIVYPTVRGMAEEGHPYTGFLYVGLMVDERGRARVVEYNCRLGDPEAQPILMRLQSDLVDLFEQALAGTLDQATAVWDPRPALGVVLAAEGYPINPRRGDFISGLPLPTDLTDVLVFHAGTSLRDGRLVTDGGRVLCVTALGEDLLAAQELAYKAVDEIIFAGMQYRTDIGHRAIIR